MINKMPKMKVDKALEILSVKKDTKNATKVRVRLSKKRLADVIWVRKVLVAKLPKYCLMSV